ALPRCRAADERHRWRHLAVPVLPVLDGHRAEYTTRSAHRDRRSWTRTTDRSHAMSTPAERNRKTAMNIQQRYLAIVLTTAFFVGFIAPICLYLTAKPFGASTTMSALADRQAKAPDTVFLPFDLRHNGAFKIDRVEQERPDILCISSSRAGTLQA